MQCWPEWDEAARIPSDSAVNVEVNGPGRVELTWGPSGQDIEVRAVGVPPQPPTQAEVELGITNHIGTDCYVAWKHPDIAREVFPDFNNGKEGDARERTPDSHKVPPWRPYGTP